MVPSGTVTASPASPSLTLSLPLEIVPSLAVTVIEGIASDGSDRARDGDAGEFGTP